MRKNKKGQLEIPSQDCKSDPPVPLATDEEKETVEDYRMQMAILTSRNRDLIETNKKLTKKVDGSLAIATAETMSCIQQIRFYTEILKAADAIGKPKYVEKSTIHCIG